MVTDPWKSLTIALVDRGILPPKERDADFTPGKLSPAESSLSANQSILETIQAKDDNEIDLEDL